MTNRRVFIRKIMDLGVISLINPSLLMANSNKEHLCILHTNDVHSHIEPFPQNHAKYPGMGGVAKRADLIARIRNKSQHTLLFDAGDMFQGTPYFNYYAGELEFKLMNAMKYDAATIGNHDFDNGIENLAKQTKNANFKLLCANYDFQNTAMKNLTKPFHVFTKGRFKVGVFGLGVELKGLVNKRMFGDTIYQDPISKGKEQISVLKNKYYCNLIICLSHLGLKYNSDKISDYILAKECPEIDIIIGGHTHTFLEKPIEFSHYGNKKTYISQVGWAGLKLGKIDVYLDDKINKPIINHTYLNI